ncbi:hypothetical protein CQW50_11390 [Xanthomonas vasicola pv. vasculorum]|nr:hypothetical protein CQW50_11390 [Xanthomonas vasicola pv. vasculorum]
MYSGSSAPSAPRTYQATARYELLVVLGASCSGGYRRLRICSRSPEQQCQERKMDELQAGIESSLAVPTSPQF